MHQLVAAMSQGTSRATMRGVAVFVTAVMALLVPLSASPALAGPVPGADVWTQPVKTSSWPTNPSYCRVKVVKSALKTKCANYQRYNRLRNAINGNQAQREWAVRFLGTEMGLTRGNQAALGRHLGNGEHCRIPTFWAMHHLALDLYKFDNRVWNNKAWAVPLLKSASSINSTSAMGTRVYQIVNSTYGAAHAAVAKKVVTEWASSASEDAYMQVLSAGINVMSADMRNKWVAKLMLDLNGSGCAY